MFWEDESHDLQDVSGAPNDEIKIGIYLAWIPNKALSQNINIYF